jgi:hypothetical protein
VPSIFKRTKNLIRASVPANDSVAPSIRSVVEMRQHLAEKHASLLKECETLARKTSDFQSLISLWQDRLDKSVRLIDFANHAIKTLEENEKKDSPDYVKAQDMLREFTILSDTASEYVRIYRLAMEGSQSRRIERQDSAAKMVDTLYRLQSFERKFALKESLKKVSEEVIESRNPELEAQEVREINRTLHTAEALLELKEADHGWDFPALPQ